MYGDNMLYLEQDGTLAQDGFSWKCGNVRGVSLQPEPPSFSGLCLADYSPSAGLYFVSAEGETTQLSSEVGLPGYSGGELGGIVKLADGSYMVAWASRGYHDDTAEAFGESRDVALLRLSGDGAPEGDVVWRTETPDKDEWNVHLAPYGDDRLLLIWNSLVVDTCATGTSEDTKACLGEFDGTWFQLLSLDGAPLTDPENIAAPPAFRDDLVVYPNGDLAWGFVNAVPWTESRVDSVDIPEETTLRIARFAYCED
jgi:hypothetical protein